ncbi:hypothetical protein OPKNFCMD_2682 [Methylobacterium crusticola]|uniref:Uncharacterized protein n=1 Tax=Methylobacterium crusticola TaxID=1697972 RepID=A0ABQ4QY20_9HYPH|nr:hypothetical protein [Methylobacterium crusticola]GJD49946.1 hypothetical protein OPKNFCMD_2682 [Methylobacterium crusticola]
MATFHEVDAVKEQAWQAVQSQLRMRPSVIGVTRCGAGFGLKVVLPRPPDAIPPASLLGVPVVYDIEERRPVLLGAAPAWLKKLDRP